MEIDSLNALKSHTKQNLGSIFKTVKTTLHNKQEGL